MTTVVLVAIGGLAVLGLAVFCAWRPVQGSLRRARFDRARRDFHQRREWLEAQAFTKASGSGKPRGLRWTECDFDDDVAYARNRRTGELAAFVAVTIAFEAIEGGPMEDVEAVSNLRAATCVFIHRRGRWHTDGRMVFNLNPTEAIAYFEDQLEMVGQELAQPN